MFSYSLIPKILNNSQLYHMFALSCFSFFFCNFTFSFLLFYRISSFQLFNGVMSSNVLLLPTDGSFPYLTVWISASLHDPIVVHTYKTSRCCCSIINHQRKEYVLCRADQSKYTLVEIIAHCAVII